MLVDINQKYCSYKKNPYNFKLVALLSFQVNFVAWKLTHSTQVSTIASILKMLLTYYTIKVHPRSNIIVAIRVIKVNV